VAAGPIGPGDFNPDNLRTSRGEITKNGPDRVVEISRPGRRVHYKTGDNVVVGKGAREDLIGGSGNDVLAALGPLDRLYGGRGEVALVAAGRGDRVYGGTGYDELVAAGRGDWLYSGPGSDTMISEHGTATVLAGRNSRVDVRNRRGNDTVICPRVNRDIVISDRGDRVSRSCRFVFVNGRGAPRSPNMVGRRGFNGSHQGTRVIGP
jgi:Ca2+-binding RTX toxin-like protein